jgi:SAM-dependent methyltransferase
VSRKEDPELRAGSCAHYEDPAYYDKTYARRSDDVAFYVELATATRGSVLEYGCGSGRVTLPIARAGKAITGIDMSAPMLAKLKTALADEPKATQKLVTLKQGDMRAAKLHRKHALVICPFNAFLHLYTREDVEHFLARVKSHLAPGGRFVFDVSIPDPEELSRKPERLCRTPPFVYPGLGRVRYGERFDYEPLRQVLFISMEFEPESGAAAFMTPLAHRQFFPRELEALLHYNGFAIEKELGDFDGKPTHESRMLVIFAKPRRSR